MSTKTIYGLLIFLLYSDILFGQEVRLDSTFGIGGKVTFDFGNAYSYARDVRMQYAGKIVVGGYTENPANDDFALVRFDQNGSIDTTFGIGGSTTTNFQFNEDDQAMSLDIASDSSIILVGPSSRTLSNSLGFSWYYSDGSMRFQGNISAGPIFDTTYQVLIQPDGKIILGGFSLFNSFLISRRLVNPLQIDFSFGDEGIAQIDCCGINTSLDLLLQPDGKILSIGVNKGFSSGNRNFSVGRFNSDGSTDSSFNSVGVFTQDFGFNYELAFAGALTSNGKIVLGGLGEYDGAFGFNMIQLSSHGQLDTTFGNSGILRADFVPHLGGESLVILPGGKIIAVGTYTQGPDEDFALLRFMPNGIVDSTFGQNGMLLTDFEGTDDRAYSVTYDSSSHSLFVVGESVDDTSAVFAIAKYNLGARVGLEKFPSIIQEAKLYPNPSRSDSQLKFSLHNSASLTIDILDLQGRSFRNITRDQFFHSGAHEVDVVMDEIPAGVYSLRILSRVGFSQIVRFVKLP
ncbi:MAG: T9SS type A sorting domain-containing protein [Bacteroidia bacterium]|nr:T9SS type A sorting domain-containing protein [Bacteroidia bacterium]